MDQAYLNQRAEPSEKDQVMQLVGFVIGKEQFGVDILSVQEIIRSASITAVPNSPDFIEGVINLRGSIIPVIDLRKRLNLPLKKKEEGSATWILIINVDERVTGFIVDSVTKVLKIQTKTIEPPPDIVVAGLKSQYIHGVCEIENGLLILLDFSRILQIKEIKKLKDFDED
ncbi:chemotaxis protein CheW [Desulfonema magnum]|uniref:Chemotaxis protein CheW n=1 Tax=Desulfonema magnum TaxID=45655 RepID=A0A975BWE7_9BACT|nr:chemotaxis protein CheW [Desulfonema magnum]QTA92617.1 Chemotaxis protein CheW [Desulfonema magnum]